MPQDLDALQKLCDAATPEPWTSGFTSPVTGPMTPTGLGMSRACLKCNAMCMPTEQRYDIVTIPKDGYDDLREVLVITTGKASRSKANADFIAAARTAMPELIAEVRRLRAWVNDLQSGMYINCVYCGHQYGPRKNTPHTMADILKEHVERCPAHPMSALKAENARLRERVASLETNIECAEHGQ